MGAWAGDAPSYNYWFVTSFAMGCMIGILTRHWFFNPDIHGRYQESRKPFPDRHRQWAFSLPYYNHRMPYMWCFTVPRYTCEDPLFTSVTHANMNRIYEEIGYSKPQPWMKNEEDED